MAVGGAAVLCACDFMPGTSAFQEKRAMEAAAQLLIDPSSAQFRNVEARERAVCGEINGKNRMGAYVGFTRFLVDTEAGAAVLDPQFDPDRLSSARRFCASIGGASCNEAIEEEAKRLDQMAFDTSWTAKCEASAAAQATRMPWDPTASSPAAPEENWVEQTEPQPAPKPSPKSSPEAADEETWFEPPGQGTAVDPETKPSTANLADGDEPDPGQADKE